MKIDFSEISCIALASIDSILEQFLPGGRHEGAEYVVKNPTRVDSKEGSFKVNTSSGIWKDFACGDGGGDLISLVAYLQGVKQGEAAKIITGALGLTQPVSRVVATFTYVDSTGSAAYTKDRVEPGRDGKAKEFFFHHIEGGKRKPGRGGEKHLYNLPAVLAAKSVIITEGEKKADLVNSWGLCATSLDSGAQSRLTPEMVGHLSGKRVVILPDNDEPGAEFAARTARELHGVAESLKVVHLPGLDVKEDILEWKEIAGNDRLRLLETIKAAPKYCTGQTSAPETGTVTKGRKKSKDEDKSKGRIRGSEASELILGLAAEIPLYRDDTDQAWTCLKGEMVLVESRVVEDWLTMGYYNQTGNVPSSEAMNGAKRVLAAKARQEGELIALYNRVALLDGAIWYDLGRGRAVQMSLNEFQVVPAPPLFQRWPHQQPHPEPLLEGDPWEFLRYCHISESNRLLILVTLIASFIPGIAHPLWHVTGPQGSGKSSFCRLVKRIVDPSVAELQIMQPEREMDFFLMLYHNYLVALDNLSELKGRTSDLLCGAATGTTVSQRALFTNLDMITLRLKNIVLLNGISPMISRADLLDRTITIHLERIPTDDRRQDREVMDEFNKALPGIMGGIFSTIAKAMTVYPTVKLEHLPRLADFAMWGYAIAEALGGYGKQFMADYAGNEAEQSEEILGQNTLAGAILNQMEGLSVWETTVASAWKELMSAAEPAKSDRTFPSKPGDMRRSMERLKVTLAEAGVFYQFGKRRRDGIPITFTVKDTKEEQPKVPDCHEFMVNETNVVAAYHPDSFYDADDLIPF